MCLRFVDLSLPQEPHIKECLMILKNLDRGNASMIYWLPFLKHQLSLDPSRIRGQANDGAPAVSSEKAGVHARRNYSISIVFPLLSPLSQSFNCIDFRKLQTSYTIINEAYLFLSNSPKQKSCFELTVQVYLPAGSTTKLPGLHA